LFAGGDEILLAAFSLTPGEHGTDDSREIRGGGWSATEVHSMRYDVVYHVGSTIDRRTRVSSGVLSLAGGNLMIEGTAPVSVPVEKLRAAELFRQNGLGTMVRVIYDGGTLFLAVPRINLFGIFLLINYFKTKELHAGLAGAMDSRPGRA
jgi:hypothetical protein